MWSAPQASLFRAQLCKDWKLSIPADAIPREEGDILIREAILPVPIGDSPNCFGGCLWGFPLGILNTNWWFRPGPLDVEPKNYERAIRIQLLEKEANKTWREKLGEKVISAADYQLGPTDGPRD